MWLQDENFQMKHTGPGLLSMVRPNVPFRYPPSLTIALLGQLRAKYKWLSSMFLPLLYVNAGILALTVSV